MDNQLPRSSVQLGHGLEDGSEQGQFTLAANVVHIIGINAVQGNTSQVSQNGIFGLDGQTGGIIKCHPVFLVIKSIRSSQVFFPFNSPVSTAKQFTDLNSKQLLKSILNFPKKHNMKCLKTINPQKANSSFNKQILAGFLNP